MKKYMRPFVAISILAICLVFITQIPVHAATAGNGDACDGLNQVGGVACGQGQKSINNVVAGVVNILSFLAGIVAVIMIIVSGIRFTTSGGDSSKIAGAKSALAIALVGVAVVVLAQVLVHFVLNTTAKG